MYLLGSDFLFFWYIKLFFLVSCTVFLIFQDFPGPLATHHDDKSVCAHVKMMRAVVSTRLGKSVLAG